MTDHVHNQLCARIEELEAEKMELNEQVDSLQEESGALAAHLERLQRSLKATMVSGWSVPAEEALVEVFSDSPQVSLARLKALWQADAVTEFAFHHLGGHEQEVAEIYASRLRQQDEGGEV